MCEVCRSEGEDYLFKNGPKKSLSNSNLYKVFKNTVAPIKLCHVHSIELFSVGEKRFLKEHLDLARNLAKRSKGADNQEDSPFGF